MKTKQVHFDYSFRTHGSRRLMSPYSSSPSNIIRSESPRLGKGANAGDLTVKPDNFIKALEMRCKMMTFRLHEGMRIPFLSRGYSALAASLALLAISTASSFGQATTVTTDPVGFYSTTCLGNSDTYVSIPFTQPPAFIGSISGVTQASGSSATITVSSTANFTVNQFVYSGSAQPSTYYAMVGPNSSGTTYGQGNQYTVIANGTNSLTVNPNGDLNVGSIAVGTQILVIPYWTLATVFPASAAGVSFTPSTSSANRLTQILIPDYAATTSDTPGVAGNGVAAAGINNSTATTYYFLNSGTNYGWREFARPVGEDHSNDVLLPNGYFILRNGATVSTGTLTTIGSVVTREQTVLLATSSSGSQDNYIAVQRPVAYQLNQLGLISSGAFASSPSSANRVDQIFLFDNTTASINKSASATYYYITSGTNVGWRQFPGAATYDVGTNTIPAGVGFLIRKGSTSGATQFWTHSPIY